MGRCFYYGHYSTVNMATVCYYGEHTSLALCKYRNLLYTLYYMYVHNTYVCTVTYLYMVHTYILHVHVYTYALVYMHTYIPMSSVENVNKICTYIRMYNMKCMYIRTYISRMYIRLYINVCHMHKKPCPISVTKYVRKVLM